MSSFSVFTKHLSNVRPNLSAVYVSPCSASKDTFSACAVVVKDGVHFKSYFEDSCLSGLYRSEEEVDLSAELVKMRNKYSLLYTHFNAQNIQDVPGCLTVQTSVMSGRNSAVSVNAHLLPGGRVLTFGPNKYFGTGHALLLQRTSFRGAKTFDAELLNGDSKTSFELRLINNCHLADLQKWGTENNMVVFRSPEIVSSNLLFRAYEESIVDGNTPEETWVVIARALTGEDSDLEDEGETPDDDEWVPSEGGSDSDESMDSEEEDEEDLLECLRD